MIAQLVRLVPVGMYWQVQAVLEVLAYALGVFVACMVITVTLAIATRVLVGWEEEDQWESKWVDQSQGKQ